MCDRQKLLELVEKFGFGEPNRGDLDDPGIKWREGKPNYDRANYAFLSGKTQNHPKGKLINKCEILCLGLNKMNLPLPSTSSTECIVDVDRPYVTSLFLVACIPPSPDF